MMTLDGQCVRKYCRIAEQVCLLTSVAVELFLNHTGVFLIGRLNISHWVSQCLLCYSDPSSIDVWTCRQRFRLLFTCQWVNPPGRRYTRASCNHSSLGVFVHQSGTAKDSTRVFPVSVLPLWPRPVIWFSSLIHSVLTFQFVSDSTIKPPIQKPLCETTSDFKWCFVIHTTLLIRS